MDRTTAVRATSVKVLLDELTYVKTTWTWTGVQYFRAAEGSRDVSAQMCVPHWV